MIQPPEDRRPPMTPQLALRVAILGSVALAIFAIIFFRLWFLQVLSGDKYVLQARVNRVREVSIPSARGDIVDREGDLLVDSKQALAVQISPPDLPHRARARARMYRRLAHVLGVSTRPRRCRVAGEGMRHVAMIPCRVAQQVAILPYANVTLKTDVPRDVLYYIDERQPQFEGVVVQQVWLRQYPLHDLAAQLFGTVGPITPQEVKMPRYRGVSEQSIVGQSGLEYYYDRYLRGRDGADRVQVDALGQFRGYLRQKAPIAGHTLKLSLDVGLQRAGQQALSEAIANNPPATAGAFVALNPQNGEVYAMGSSPTFDPNIFTKPVPEAVYKRLNNTASNYPLFNRAIQSSYPTGSTFKGISSIAALQSGAWSLDEAYDDTGVYSNGPGDTRHNAGHAAYGVLNLTQAIMVSSDNFFYNLGRLMNSNAPKGGALQHWAHLLGMGRPTGIDLGGENAGILPSPAWRAGRDKLERECERGTGPFRGHGRHKTCGIADGRPWSVGDNENLAVGQGDLEATPLQLAVAYSTIENGGDVVRPHVGLEVDALDGTLLQRIDPPPARRVHITPAYLDAIRTGLHDAASQPGGTSADVFAGWPQSQYPVYGKTGTAQHDNQADQSWYVCYVPDPSRPIVVVVTVEQGGFGAMAAAPAARQILSQWFMGKRGSFIAGSSKTL
jgi:penicillin-binding protein 2